MAPFLKGPFEVDVTFWPCVLSKLPHGKGSRGSWRFWPGHIPSVLFQSRKLKHEAAYAHTKHKCATRMNIHLNAYAKNYLQCIYWGTSTPKQSLMRLLCQMSALHLNCMWQKLPAHFNNHLWIQTRNNLALACVEKQNVCQVCTFKNMLQQAFFKQSSQATVTRLTLSVHAATA